MTTSTQGGGNNTHRKHKTSKHNKAHAEGNKKKKKSAAPPHLNRCRCLRSLGMCARYPVPFFGCLLALENFWGAWTTKQAEVLIQQSFYIIIWTYQLFEKGGIPCGSIPRAEEETPHPAQGSPARVTWIYYVAPHDPPSAFAISRLSGLGQQELVGACR